LSESNRRGEKVPNEEKLFSMFEYRLIQFVKWLISGTHMISQILKTNLKKSPEPVFERKEMLQIHLF
jgi:hypothetical protein